MNLVFALARLTKGKEFDIMIARNIKIYRWLVDLINCMFDCIDQRNLMFNA